MSLTERWEQLAPGLRRGLVLGGATAVALALAALLVSAPKEERRFGEERKRLITNLLTDADPRALGIDGLAERLRRVEGRLDQVASGLEKLGLTKDAEPAVDVLLARLRTENAKALAALKAEQETLRRELEQARVPQGNASVMPPAGKPEVARTAPATPDERPLARLFEETGRHTAPTAGSLGVRTPAAGPKNALTIRLVADETKPEAPSATDDAVLIPAGSILRAVFLSGMDAPTGQQARRDPFPALARIKHDAILPNRFRADVRECFLVVAGYGDLPSERAYLRSETITCVRSDGGAIEVALDGYAVGEDGKAGVRGRLVSKQGALLAKAMLASFVDGFSKLVSTVPVTAISTSPGTSAQYQQVFSTGSLQGAAVGGAGKALDRLATYFLDTAEQMHPVIEIDAGRAVEFVLNRGATLRLAPERRR
jgi:conjugal transfer pilus assembly protein TraB